MKINKPFFVFNPKSYLYGEELIHLAKVADKAAQEYPEVLVFVTAPYADLQKVKDATSHVIVTAQHIDGIYPGRGIGHVLPESVYAAGARATFLNHAEKPLLVNELVKSISRAKELGILTIVCADSLQEAKAIAKLEPDCILCEPTELIGTGETSSEEYIQTTNEAIKSINSSIAVMQAAGISDENDVFRTISLGADGTGCTSGIVKAENPSRMIEKMIEAVAKASENKS